MKKIILYILAAISAAAATAAVLLFVFSVKNISQEPAIDVSVEALELSDYGGEYKFWFSQLSNEGKHAYNLILESIYSMPDEIAINRIDSEELDAVFYALMSDNPDLFFVGRKCVLRAVGNDTWFSVDYIIEKNDYKRMKSELDSVCREVAASFTNPADQWQTELEIHDYIIDNCTYVLDENLGSTAYGVLVNGSGACEGYSKAAKLLLDKAGIENAIVSGYSESETSGRGPHMWNVVTLDGEKYYLDCTWDDPVDGSGEQSKTYIYFNVDSETLLRTHSELSYDFGCNAMQANYFVKTGAYFESYDRSLEQTLADVVVSEMSKGNQTVYFRFGNEEAYDKAVKDLLKKERIYTVLKLAKSGSEFSFSTKTTGYITDDVHMIFAVIPKTE